MSDAPPTRYQVVEQDRRLVVVDTWAGGGRATALAPAGDLEEPRRPSLLALPTRTRFDGGATLTTHALYDANGPRTLQLDAGSATLTAAARFLVLAFVVVLAVMILFTPWLMLPAFWFGWSARGWCRTRITRWLDRIEREAG